MTTIKTIRIAAILAASTVTCDLGLSQTSGARNQAMGGTGVASSTPQTAPFVNPAMIRHGADRQAMPVLASFAGAYATNEGDFVDEINHLQDSLDALKTLLTAGDFAGADALRPTVTRQLNDLNGNSIDVLGAGGVGFVAPFEDLTVAFSARTFVDARALTFVDSADLTTIATSTDVNELDFLRSTAAAVAAEVTEFGVSLATDFQALGRDCTFGVTSKTQTVETYNYADTVSLFDEDEARDSYENDRYRDGRSSINVDVGAAMNVGGGLTAALSVQNLISDTYQTVIARGRQYSYRVEPRPVLGLALCKGGLTLTGDVELLATTRFEEVPDSKYVRAGAEYGIASWAQLRAGFAFDLEKAQADVFSAGVGLFPAHRFQVDLIGQVSEDGAGAGLQLALNF